MIVDNYYDLIWTIATGLGGSSVFFISVCLVFDYLRTMLFSNK